MPGRFQPGRSGNPAGKPKGAKNRTLLALDKIGAENAEPILQAAVRAAIGDDTTPPDLRAAELILSRVWPARKGRAVAIDLPAIIGAGDLPAALAAVVAAVSRGDVTPDEAAAVAAVLEAQRRAIETADIEKRLAALEARANE